MSDRTYLVAVDAREPASEAGYFRQAVKGNPLIKHWWNHIPYVYLVESSATADEVSESIVERTGLTSFLVMEVNPSESEGLLPGKAWNWIRKRSQVPAA